MSTTRKKLLLALLGSALLHVMLLLTAALLIGLDTQRPTPPALRPIPLEVVKSEPLPSTAPTPELQVVDTSKMTAVERPAKDATFAGERDTVAASEGPTTGDKPLPSQEGLRVPTYVFDPSPPSPGAARSQATAEAEPPVTAPSPPQPARKIQRPPSEKPEPPRVRGDLAMLDTAPTPPPEEVNPYDPSFRSTAPPPPVPVRSGPRPAAYRPLSDRAASDGSITNHGTSSVDAVATPYGRYRKQVLDSIRVVYIDSLQAHGDVASLGTVTLHFALDRTGHVHTLRIVSNSANEGLASITLDAVTRTAIPPIPADVVETMDGAMLQLDVTFECL